jgi:hypothetical protein
MAHDRYEGPVATAIGTLRWTEETRHWLRLCSFPATAEQLTAQLLAVGAPNWLLWRLSAAAPDNRMLDSVDVVLRLLRHSDRHPGAAQPARFYAG